MGPWRDAEINVLEIGVKGNSERSVQTWNDYFSRAQVFAADDSQVQPLERWLPLKQGNMKQLQTVAAHRPWTVIVDDGTHLPSHQIRAFEVLFPSLQPEGVYVIESVETSYWASDRSTIYGYSLNDEPDVVSLFLRAARDAVNREFHCEAPPPVFSREIDAQIGSVNFIRNAIVIRKPPEGYAVRAEIDYRYHSATCAE